MTRGKIVGIGALLVVFLSVLACKTVYLPIETGTTVNVKDSTAIHYIDSIRIKEETRYKDFTGLLDTLKINGQRSRMWAAADTTRDALVGGLEEDSVEEKVKIIYKTKWMVKDSIRIEEKPVPYPVEVVKKEVPRWCWWSLVINILGLLTGAFVIYLKVRTHNLV